MTQYKSAREITKAITDGDIPPSRIGPGNFAILKQELFSMRNEYKPLTMTDKELLDYNKRLAEKIEQIATLSSGEQTQLYEQVDKMLNP